MCAALLGLTTLTGCQVAKREGIVTASAVPLVNTNWRLTQLGGELVDNPAGERAVNLQLQQQNARATGFAGCNRMFGGYLLSNDTLKFDQLGSTKMACLDENRMKLEQRFFTALSQVARWKISGSTLELLGADGAKVATFAAETPLN